MIFPGFLIALDIVKKIEKCIKSKENTVIVAKLKFEIWFFYSINVSLSALFTPSRCFPEQLCIFSSMNVDRIKNMKVKNNQVNQISAFGDSKYGGYNLKSLI